MRFEDVTPPATAAASSALTVARTYYSPALLHHCERSYRFAAAAGDLQGIHYDSELLYAAALLHDLGLVPVFDSHRAPFEDAGGHVAAVFATAAGWPELRRQRVVEVIVRHMWEEVDPDVDPEGYLLEKATGFDISGRGATLWPTPFTTEVLAHYPRLSLNEEFAALFEDQAQRKPSTAAASAVSSGIRERLASNVLNDLGYLD